LPETAGGDAGVSAVADLARVDASGNDVVVEALEADVHEHQRVLEQSRRGHGHDQRLAEPVIWTLSPWIAIADPMILDSRRICTSATARLGTIVSLAAQPSAIPKQRHERESRRRWRHCFIAEVIETASLVEGYAEASKYNTAHDASRGSSLQ